MHITRHTDYALRVLIYLGLYPERTVTTREIADAYGISHHHLAKVTQRLKALAFTTTLPGRSGGLRLARRADAIGVGEIVRCMETDLRLVECFDPTRNSCPIGGACQLEGALGRALAAFMDVLDEYTLEDLLASRSKLRHLLATHPRQAPAPARTR